MLEHLKRLSGQTIIFGIGNAVTRLAGLFLLPIYTRILTQDDYGRLAIVTLATAAVAMVVSFGQGSAFFRFYGFAESTEERKVLNGTEFLFLCFGAFVVLAPLYIFAKPIAGSFFRDSGVPSLIQLALIGVFFDTQNLIPFATFRAKQQAVQYAGLSALRFLINVVLSIVIVAVLHQGVHGAVLANVITSALFAVICTLLTLRSVTFKLDRALLRRLLAYGIPLVPASIAGLVLSLSNRMFLEQMADLRQVGIFAVATSFAGVINSVTGWFNTAYMPFAFDLAKRADARRIYSRVFSYIMFVCALLALGLTFFAPELLTVLATNKYSPAIPVIPLIIAAYIFYEINYLISLSFDMSGKTGYYFPTVAAGAVCNLALNFLLIPRFHIMGAALSMLISYAVMPVFGYPLAQKQYRIDYEIRKLAVLFGVTVVLCAGSLLIPQINPVVNIFIKLVLLGVWYLLLRAFGFISKSEMTKLRAEVSGFFKDRGRRRQVDG